MVKPDPTRNFAFTPFSAPGWGKRPRLLFLARPSSHSPDAFPIWGEEGPFFFVGGGGGGGGGGPSRSQDGKSARRNGEGRAADRTLTRSYGRSLGGVRGRKEGRGHGGRSFGEKRAAVIRGREERDKLVGGGERRRTQAANSIPYDVSPPVRPRAFSI